MAYPTASAGTNSKATASLVCGIVSLFCLGIVLGVVAIVLGTNAKKEIAGSGESGEGLATAGIVLGVIGVIGWTIYLLTRLG